METLTSGSVRAWGWKFPRATRPYIKVRGHWMYLYRAIDSVGDTVEFLFSQHRDLWAAKQFFRKASERHGRPDRIIIDAARPTGKLSFPATQRTGFSTSILTPGLSGSGQANT